MASKLDRTPPLLRALSLLERIARADGPMTLREATDGSGLPKPTVYRMLARSCIWTGSKPPGRCA